jgi:hypothetical protein
MKLEKNLTKKPVPFLQWNLRNRLEKKRNLNTSKVTHALQRERGKQSKERDKQSKERDKQSKERDKQSKEREGTHSKESEGMHSEERGFTGIGETPRLVRYRGEEVMMAEPLARLSVSLTSHRARDAARLMRKWKGGERCLLVMPETERSSEPDSALATDFK